MPLGENGSRIDRRRPHEEEYFRKRDQEVIEKARLESREQAMRQALAERTGVSDDECLSDLRTLGYTADTVALLPLVPLIAVAWADGEISTAERQIIETAAHARGIQPDSEAARQLSVWLANRPAQSLLHRSLRAFAVMLQGRPPADRATLERSISASCTTVAAASGGVFGFLAISDLERRELDRILFEFERSGAPSRGRE